MKYLTDVYNQVASRDADLEKQAAELYKQAEEEAYAGRITARGFADELQKLAAGSSHPYGVKNPTVPIQSNTKPAQTGGSAVSMRLPESKTPPAAKGPAAAKGQPSGGAGGVKKPNMGEGYNPMARKPAFAGGNTLAGGTSKGPTVGAPGMGRRSSQQPSAGPKPAVAGAPKRGPVVAGQGEGSIGG
jgi:hypothetical protein